MARTTQRRRRTRDAEETPVEEEYEARAREEDEEEEEARPRRKSKSKKKEKSSSSKWDEFRAKGGGKTGFPDRLKFEIDKPLIVKFLSSDPFSVYLRHWINEMPRGERKSYVCTEEDDCPLCEAGHEPETRVAFNVVVVGKDGEYEEPSDVKIWECPAGLAATLSDLNEDKRKGPLDKEYWEVLQEKQKNGFIGYQVHYLKSSDLEEDLDIPPLNEEELEAYEDLMYTEKDYVKAEDIEDLEAAADFVANIDHDDDDEEEEEERPRKRRSSKK